MSTESGVLVIHCSDPRYQAPFHDFLRNQLKLSRYALLAVPGGPQFLGATELLPKFNWAGWRWVKFLGKLGNTDRVILIAHDDCRWYADALQAAGRERQLKDLREVADGLRERFSPVKVELYFARLTDAGAAFDAV